METEDRKQWKDVELRSEEVQEVMGQIPPWILRWGITLLFVVVLALVIVSIFFKYPDVITSEMTLTGRFPATGIIARSSGKISHLLVKEGTSVEKGTLLAVLENAALTEDVAWLKLTLTEHLSNPDSTAMKLMGKGDLSLGDVQSAYSSFLSQIHEYVNYRMLDYYPKKITQTQKQIGQYKDYALNVEQQLRVMESQYEIARSQFDRDSLLFSRQVLSDSEYEMAKATLLQSRHSLEGARASLDNLKIQISSQETTLLDLELQQAEKESVLAQSYHRAAEELQNAINNWELNYCLISPVRGKITFTTYRTENLYVTQGENIFTVVPEESDELLGKAYLPIYRSGKVKEGQRVIIRFNNFPDQEFGYVEGRISSVSLVPSDENYLVEITLSNGLMTNYDRELPASQEMKATADIVTEDLRLIERFFMPLKKVLKEGF
ncbi:HlyD family secretion protein [Massilibacteroides vaginae]|uniref:HlyD family secretion protein n=1 Tax=Massilibacteroides vaginae TaxID=1673718 RepID=UPI000A1CD452|nr:HlyD family efflux transporter periplasmic adaptor subunit [Massilibacteroides vaginae]